MSIPFNPQQFVRGRPTKRISVAQVKPTQVYVNADKVRSMARKPAGQLPPVVASADGDLYDGHHRYGSALLKGRKTLDAVVY